MPSESIISYLICFGKAFFSQIISQCFSLFVDERGKNVIIVGEFLFKASESLDFDGSEKG